jgi:hypothetical protein
MPQSRQALCEHTLVHRGPSCFCPSCHDALDGLLPAVTAQEMAACLPACLPAYLESADLAALPESRISLSPVMSAVEATRLAFSTANRRAVQASHCMQVFDG